jgi:U5 small nuclear ribonucleoprotein component
MINRFSFLVDLMKFPEFVRNIAVIGHIHHGKSSLLDLLIEQTHDIEWTDGGKVAFTHLYIIDLVDY